MSGFLYNLFVVSNLDPLKCLSSMSNTKTKVDYNLIKQQIGTVVIDNNFKQYVVSDYKLGCDAYQLWDKEDQQFYYTDYNAFNALYTQISG